MNTVELRVEMIRHGDNNTTLAKALGKSIPLVCHKIKGRQKFTQPEMQIIIDRYALTPERIQTIFFT
jgi:hypothetical protein